MAIEGTNKPSESVEQYEERMGIFLDKRLPYLRKLEEAGRLEASISESRYRQLLFSQKLAEISAPTQTDSNGGKSNKDS